MTMIKFIIISGISISLFSCAANSEPDHKTQQINSNIGIKNPTEVDSLSLKLKEIEVLIESNEKVIEGLKKD